MNTNTEKSLAESLPKYRMPEEKTEYHTTTGYYGIMEPDSFDGDPIRQIEEMYGDDPGMPRSKRIDGDLRRSLHGHTRFADSREQELKMVGTVPQYNRYHPSAVQRAVEQFPDSAYVAVGREGSPVLYIWTDQCETVTEILDGITAENEDEEDGIFGAGGPDELGVIVDAEEYPQMTVGESPSTVGDGPQGLIRAWWD